MKKILSRWNLAKKSIITFAGIGLLLVGLVVYAVGSYAGVNVTSIPQKTNGDYVTADEFNLITNTVRGIYNTYDGVRHRIGLNNTPLSNIDFDLGGSMRLGDITNSTCNTTVEGAVYFNSVDKHFWGCNGSTWEQLDGGAVTPNLNAYDFTCQAVGTWIQESNNCNPETYVSGDSYATNAVVCIDKSTPPANADCTAAAPSAYSYTCGASGTWSGGSATCGPVNYNGASTYTKNDTVCAYPTPDNKTCDIVAPPSAYSYTCGASGTWSGGSATCGPVNYVVGDTYPETTVVCADTVPANDDCAGGGRVCTGASNYETQCSGGNVYNYGSSQRCVLLS